MKTICIYHGNCADGFGAAYAVWKFYKKHNILKNVEFFKGVYSDSPPDVSNKKVIIVDFSYKREVMEQIVESAHSVTVLDHHKTAIDDLEELMRTGAITGVFDINRSGAMITWEYFHEKPAPQLLHHIQDRDLWKFELENTREIQAALYSYPYDFEVWDNIIMEDNMRQLCADGIAIERKHFKDIKELLKVCQRRMTIAGHDVPVASLPYTLSSDAGHIMAENEPFAACYWDTPKGRVFSLRSSKDGIDVSEIAKEYGGGGHRNAAGFTITDTYYFSYDNDNYLQRKI